MKQRGFTLVEMLTVIAILAMLYALFMPALLAARGAVMGYSAQMGMKNLTGTLAMYAGDHDDTFPLAMYVEGSSLRTWFGLVTSGETDTRGGLLAAYGYDRGAKDPVFKGAPYLGDMTGYGYNWGFLGSDTNMTLDYRNWPNSSNPARGTELADSSQTIAFTTSAYFHAPWLPNGDGQVYDFGFIDPPMY